MFDGLRGEIDELQRKVSELGAHSPGELSGFVVEAHREFARLEATVSELTQHWDAVRAWSDDGARSGAAWLAGRCGIPRQVAGRFVKLARATRTMPCTTKAWLAGDIMSSHVDALARARNPRSRLRFMCDEHKLVDIAARKTFLLFEIDLAEWLQEADPDGAENRSETQHAKRGFDFATSIHGMGFGKLTLDPLNAAAFGSVLDPIVDELFRADWNAAKERLGGDCVTLADLGRTPTQRRADALIEMAKRAATAPIDGRRPAPLFTVLTGIDTVKKTAQLANGTVITPGSLVPWLTGAYVERVVFESPSRVIDVGTPRRFFRGALRRAIEVRDRRCYHELCEIPADRCHVDHIIPAGAEGPTTQENGRLACDYHNWLRQRRPEPPP